jgi:hypothetical protein
MGTEISSRVSYSLASFISASILHGAVLFVKLKWSRETKRDFECAKQETGSVCACCCRLWLVTCSLDAHFHTGCHSKVGHFPLWSLSISLSFIFTSFYSSRFCGQQTMPIFSNHPPPTHTHHFLSRKIEKEVGRVTGGSKVGWSVCEGCVWGVCVRARVWASSRKTMQYLTSDMVVT